MQTAANCARNPACSGYPAAATHSRRPTPMTRLRRTLARPVPSLAEVRGAGPAPRRTGSTADVKAGTRLTAAGAAASSRAPIVQSFHQTISALKMRKTLFIIAIIIAAIGGGMRVCSPLLKEDVSSTGRRLAAPIWGELQRVFKADGDIPFMHPQRLLQIREMSAGAFLVMKEELAASGSWKIKPRSFFYFPGLETFPGIGYVWYFLKTSDSCDMWIIYDRLSERQIGKRLGYAESKGSRGSVSEITGMQGAFDYIQFNVDKWTAPA